MHALGPQEATALFQKGMDQFNRGEFFESHESWELIWLPAPEPDKTFLQGIIQVAAALHHYRRGNLSGARSLLRRGLAKMEPFPADYRGLDVDDLRSQSQAWKAYLHHATGQAPAFPAMNLRRC